MNTSGSFNLRILTGLAILCLSLSSAALPKTNQSRAQFGRSITIGPNENVGDLSCFACSIRIRGNVAGDVATFGGNIQIEDQGQVAGDVASFAGDVRVAGGAKIAGDVAVFAGRLSRDPQATISGDVSAMGGRGWIIPILLFPLVVVGLLVALIVWLVQRGRRPSIPAAA
jgi:hypothetical protein